MSTKEYLLETYGPTMTPAHVGGVTHRHPSHIRALCQAGELPAVKVGGRWLIVTAKLGAMLDGEVMADALE